MDPETTISTLLMHDHYNYDLFAENCVTFGSKNKKKDAYELDLEGSPNITWPNSQIQEYANINECKWGAMD